MATSEPFGGPAVVGDLLGHLLLNLGFGQLQEFLAMSRGDFTLHDGVLNLFRQIQKFDFLGDARCSPVPHGLQLAVAVAEPLFHRHQMLGDLDGVEAFPLVVDDKGQVRNLGHGHLFLYDAGNLLPAELGQNPQPPGTVDDHIGAVIIEGNLQRLDQADLTDALLKAIHTAERSCEGGSQEPPAFRWAASEPGSRKGFRLVGGLGFQFLALVGGLGFFRFSFHFVSPLMVVTLISLLPANLVSVSPPFRFCLGV
jgi:hypothetical protein